MIISSRIRERRNLSRTHLLKEECYQDMHDGLQKTKKGEKKSLGYKKHA